MEILKANANDAGQRLDKFLSKRYKSMPQSLLYKYIRTKRIKLNGKRAKENQLLADGDEITLYIPDEFTGGSRRDSYIVIDPGATPLAKYQLLTEREYRTNYERYEDEFKVGMGAEAIKELLSEINIEELSENLKKELASASGQKKLRIVKRLEVVEAFRKSGNRPEWMILDVVPVIPPEIRPMVQLDGGRFASSDINKLFSKFDRLGVEKETSVEGTGLGLAITKKLVELMHGNVTVQSEYGSGSKFIIRVDQKILKGQELEDAKNKKPVQTEQVIDAHGKKVLVVDDNLLNIKVAERLLAKYNVTLESVMSGPL